MFYTLVSPLLTKCPNPYRSQKVSAVLNIVLSRAKSVFVDELFRGQPLRRVGVVLGAIIAGPPAQSHAPESQDRSG